MKDQWNKHGLFQHPPLEIGAKYPECCFQNYKLIISSGKTIQRIGMVLLAQMSTKIELADCFMKNIFSFSLNSHLFSFQWYHVWVMKTAMLLSFSAKKWPHGCKAESKTVSDFVPSLFVPTKRLKAQILQQYYEE